MFGDADLAGKLNNTDLYSCVSPKYLKILAASNKNRFRNLFSKTFKSGILGIKLFIILNGQNKDIVAWAVSKYDIVF